MLLLKFVCLPACLSVPPSARCLLVRRDALSNSPGAGCTLHLLSNELTPRTCPVTVDCCVLLLQGAMAATAVITTGAATAAGESVSESAEERACVCQLLSHPGPCAYSQDFVQVAFTPAVWLHAHEQLLASCFQLSAASTTTAASYAGPSLTYMPAPGSHCFMLVHVDSS